MSGWHSTIIERAYERGNRNQSLRPRIASPSFSASHRERLRQFQSAARKRLTLPDAVSPASSAHKRQQDCFSHGTCSVKGGPELNLESMFPPEEQRSQLPSPMRQCHPRAENHYRAKQNGAAPTFWIPSGCSKILESPLPSCLSRAGCSLRETSWHRLHDARCGCAHESIKAEASSVSPRTQQRQQIPAKTDLTLFQL